ncbi:peptide methionine sulfoxide reductase [Flavilitoribacter nigricans]|uniref:Peptide methionine sulfoxide reductase n=1 Tax=Flavilitoribacter nigricans (strain ATCC 23147 / DSM 23189 / NBRC 102662 / NCIMB 1420 / SS-2) TaxID=1122177 RepID=A0A2D0NC29_FLAN2|nr:peptide methionine sulfoxide reductase [Flavilitoribacter nigricans]PHN06047.1 peptide methionine sulfoxide reductase [Flavilitoribacter nigricans DSM 23189 = NBRC 102662]
MDLAAIIREIPTGYSEVVYRERRYSLTRENLAGGKSIKVFARELGGTDFISFNYYLTSDHTYLKPCEMPERKVLDFLSHMRFLPNGKED